MNPTPHLIPVLPESAPFTPEQRAYLNGFLAGLFSRAPGSPTQAPANPPTTKRLLPLTILFGSQTGNAERLAKRIGKEAGTHGFAPAVHDLAAYPVAQLASEQSLVIVTSTFGDGEPPDNARAFWEFLNGSDAPKLPGMRFSVLALGDSNYPRFCHFGRQIDERLEALGAIRAHPRRDCDVDFETSAAEWIGAALPALAGAAADPSATPRELPAVAAERSQPAAPEPPSSPRYSRTNPFPAALLVNRRLSGSGSAKEVRHIEFSLDDSGLHYEVGDALGVMPSNCPELVERLLRRLGCHGDEPVPVPGGGNVPFRSALLTHYDITRIQPALVAAAAARAGDPDLLMLADAGAGADLAKFVRGRDPFDLLEAFPKMEFTPTEFVQCLRKLTPRLYSIASSPKRHPGQVHLTVGVVRYESFGRARKGVCSTFMADRIAPGDRVPVFVHSSPSFRPPAPDRPLIMIGPGTGIAPFRAFLEERMVTGASGLSWLFFGDQHESSDFLYREELESMRSQGVLTRIDLAWSRDQPEKIYVQHRMLEHAKELFDWLENGAGMYVCGDASRMAKDVDAALHAVIRQGGGFSPDQAVDYVARLKAEKRYQRDVY